MVSTRGGTRTAGADDKTSTAKRNAPVRKTTAKTTQPAAKAKTTRSKKTEPEPEQPADDEEDEIQLAQPPPKATRRAPAAKPEPTKRAATRSKKDEEPVKAVAPKPAPRATKATSTAKATSTTKTTKAKTTKDDKPSLAPPAPAPTKATRATRATRATAAKERAPPLSPKKITQVSKVAPKTTRPATKPKAPVAPSKRATRRRRNVSDENAPVLAPTPADDESEAEDVLQSKQEKAPQAKVKSTAKVSLVEDETPASSRPTTPSDGIGQSFNETEDEKAGANDEEEEDDYDEEEEEDGTEEGDTTNNASHDELCGPKTPMKRSGPRFGTQRSSRAKDLDVPSKTPVRRFAVLGTQQGTPQTTKPYRKPTIPLSEARPTTVARARDRAMVFPRLQPLAAEVDESQDDQSESVEEEGTPVPVDMGTDVPEMAMDVEGTAASDEHEITPEFQPDEELTLSPDQPSHSQDIEMLEDADLDEPNSENQEPEKTYELEETVVEHDAEPESVPASETEASFDSNDSVIITRRPASTEYESELDNDMELEEMPTTTPKPETLVWENIRQDVTIPFDFDADMTLSRSLPQVEHNDRLSIANDFIPASQEEPDAVAGAEEEEQETTNGGQAHVETNVEGDTSEQSMGPGRESLDATVNLSDFIDVRSLSESRRQSHLVFKAGNAESEAQVSPTPMATAPLEDTFDFDIAVDDSPDETQHATEEHPANFQAPQTPARQVSELDIALDDLQQQPAPGTPRYAMPTISSRRKSLPAKLYPGTLLKEGVRPQTSDGANLPSIATPSRASMRHKLPALSRPTTAHGLRSTVKAKNNGQTPRARNAPMAKTPGTSVPLAWQSTAKNGTPFAKTPISRTLFAATPGTSFPVVEDSAVKERFPGLPSRNAYELDSNAVETPLASTSTPAAKERFPAMPPRDDYEPRLETPPTARRPSSTTTSAVKSTPRERFPGLPSKDNYEELTGEQAEEPATPADRYPGLPHRRTYEEHAKTAMPASRFRTPSHSPAKRPATVQKQASLRKVALKASTPVASRTPMKTPLKAPAFTPGNVPMTPHPTAPLSGVVALVEVYTSDGDCATPAFAALVQRLGGKTTKTFSERLTHVIYKEGSPNTLQRLRIHNKQVLESGSGKEIHCVNSRWVTDCDAQGIRMPESDEAYAVEVDDAPRTAKRRRKSMEPMSLTNIRGSVFRDRKSSLGRSSLGRAPMKMDSSPEEDTTPIIVEDKENSGDDCSPSTPAYLAAPSSLVQQTAPLHKVRKLDFKSGEAAKNRRLTFWNGGA